MFFPVFFCKQNTGHIIRIGGPKNIGYSKCVKNTLLVIISVISIHFNFGCRNCSYKPNDCNKGKDQRKPAACNIKYINGCPGKSSKNIKVEVAAMAVQEK